MIGTTILLGFAAGLYFSVAGYIVATYMLVAISILHVVLVILVVAHTLSKDDETEIQSNPSAANFAMQAIYAMIAYHLIVIGYQVIAGGLIVSTLIAFLSNVVLFAKKL